MASKYALGFIAVRLRLMIVLFLQVGWLITGVCQQPEMKRLEDEINKLVYKNPEEGLRLAGRLDSLSRMEKDSNMLASALNLQGMCSNVLGDPEAALDYFLSSQKLYIALNEDWHVARLYNNIGAAYNFRDDPVKTIYYYEQALSGFRRLKDTLWMGKVLYNLSTQKNAQGLYDEDLRMKEEALGLLERMGDSNMVYLIAANIAHTYYTLGDYPQSLASVSRYLESSFAQQPSSVKANALLTYAFTLRKLGDAEGALKATKESLTISENLGLKEREMKAHAHLAALYEDGANPVLALHHFKRYHETYETYFNETKDQRIEELLIAYETEKKESQIARLEWENNLHEEKIIQARRARWWLWTGIILLAIFGTIVLRLQWLRHRTNSRLTKVNKQLALALDEKSILLREIHHRVKNNLQVISSLLKLQSHYIEDEQAVRAIAEGRNRVHSMALLHQNLYKEDNLKGVDMQEYFTNLIEGLFDTYNIDPDGIRLDTNIQSLALDIDTVIPLGLIANELISNALKHAFTDIKEATLNVRLWEEDHHLFLEVKDNGKGFDPETTATHKKSFGQKLIRSLTEKINGELTIENNQGTCVLLKIQDYQISI